MCEWILSNVNVVHVVEDAFYVAENAWIEYIKWECVTSDVTYSRIWNDTLSGLFCPKSPVMIGLFCSRDQMNVRMDYIKWECVTSDLIYPHIRNDTAPGFFCPKSHVTVGLFCMALFQNRPDTQLHLVLDWSAYLRCIVCYTTSFAARLFHPKSRVTIGLICPNSHVTIGLFCKRDLVHNFIGCWAGAHVYFVSFAVTGSSDIHTCAKKKVKKN